MDEKKIITLFRKVKAGKLSARQAFLKLKHLPYEDLKFAKVDHHRPMRTGFPEVVFCPGKRIEQIIAIFKSISQRNKNVLLTRADERIFRKIKKIDRRAAYNKVGGTIYILEQKPRSSGYISVVCAGTADLPVAEEAAVTATVCGSRVERVYDVGVAGLHRLLASFERIARSRCVIVIAGMDGVLPSVVGGLVSCPVIAVPTSVGYGANFNGIAPLLTMLNTCAPGVSVVNINNGFGAGYIASLIHKMSLCKNQNL